MPNPRLAGRYAKSLIGLAVERGQLEEVFQDMQYLQAICKSSRELILLLKSPVINSDKKEAILKAVTAGKIGKLTEAFNALLINKGREEALPEIAVAFIEQYKRLKNIHSIKLTTATAISEGLKQSIVDQVKAQTQLANIELSAEVNESLIGGFQLEMGDILVDASIAYDLNKIRSQFLNNDFIYKIR